MANVNNAFAALLGAGEAPSAGKAKKKSKAKQAEQNGSHAVDVLAPVPATTNGHAATPSVVEVSEAIAILERAAREARSIAEKSKLWKEWGRQVRAGGKLQAAPSIDLHDDFFMQAADRGGKGIKYRAAGGATLDFKQV
jgi:hypothetical protein